MSKRGVDIYGGRDPREIPVYTYRDAARCLNLPASTLKAWAEGQSNFRSILRSKNREQLSFFELVELWVIYDLRQRFHFPMQELRRLFKDLKSQFPHLRHPIAEADLSVLSAEYEAGHVRKPGRPKLYARSADSPLVSLSRSQIAFEKVMSTLLTRVEKTPDAGIARLYPFITKDRREDAPRTVAVDPLVAFGKPVIAGTGIPTSAVFQLFNAGNLISEIAEEYDRPTSEIEDAIRFETVRSKAA